MTITKNKKIGIALLLLLSVASIFYLWSTGHRKSGQNYSFSPPNIDVGGKAAGLNIRLNIDGRQFSFPDSLPVYAVDNTPFSDQEMLQISQRFGFDSQPLILNDLNQGRVYLWSAENADLRIVPGVHIIDYKYNPASLSQNPTFPDSQEIIAVASHFISDKQILALSDFSFSKVRFIDQFAEENVVVDKSFAEVVDVHFVEKINSYPIINVTFEAGTVSVKMNKDDLVISLYVDLAGQLASIGEFPIKSFTDLDSSLSEAQIISIENLDSSLLDKPDAIINRIELTSISIAYLQESKASQVHLQPVFVLEGVAYLTGTNEERKTVLFLPALKFN